MNNVLILTYWSYRDALIQTYTLPYVRIIRKNLPTDSSVFLLTLEKDQSILSKSKRDKIAAQLQKEGIHWIPFAYKPFGAAAFLLWIRISLQLCLLIIRKRVSTIHCWCTPPGAIGYFLSILLNRKLVLDSYEPHAEAMTENGTWTKNSIAFNVLFYLEKLQSRKAHFIISATAGMKNYAKEKYTINLTKFAVKPACVDLDLFSEKSIKDADLLKELDLEQKIVCVYAGKFGGIYLAQEVFDFFKIAHQHFGNDFRVLLLTNQTKEEIESYCKKSNLDSSIITMRFIAHQLIPKYIGLGDFAITPVKPVPTKRFCTPIKDGEYWAMGLPIIIPANISDDSEIIEKHKAGAVLHELNDIAYLDAVKTIEIILSEPKIERYKRIRALAETYRSFAVAEQVYKNLYGHL